MYAIGYEDDELGPLLLSRRRRLIASTMSGPSVARLGGRAWDPEMNEPWTTESLDQAREALRKVNDYYDSEHFLIDVEEQRDDGSLRGPIIEPEEMEP